MRDRKDSTQLLLGCALESSSVAIADIEARTRFARKPPDTGWPSSDGWGVIWKSSTDTAEWVRTATPTETRYGLIAQDRNDERAALITGESTCRGSKDIDKHIADKHRVGTRTLKTATAHGGDNCLMLGLDALSAIGPSTENSPSTISSAASAISGLRVASLDNARGR